MSDPLSIPELARTMPYFAAPVNLSPTVPFPKSELCNQCRSQSLLEVRELTSALIQKFEELTMIHQFTERLSMDVDRVSLCRDLIKPLLYCVRATTLAIQLNGDKVINEAPVMVQTGQPRDVDWLDRIATKAQQLCGDSLTIVNHPLFDGEDTRRVLVMPIMRGECCFGRMIAIGADQAEEFGSLEAELMRSTSLMLAVQLCNQRQFIQLRLTLDESLAALVSALDAKDRYTHGHSHRVAELSVALARDLKLSEKDCEILRKSALLHDIGKIGVNDTVLGKHGKLTDEEFAEIKRHPVIGYDILKSIGAFEPLLPGVLHHHEAWNGAGYPHGLKGEQIPRMAQIIAVADAFDAMTSDRPYRAGMPLERVKQIFEEGIGVQWAPDVATILVTQIAVLSKLVNVRRATA